MRTADEIKIHCTFHCGALFLVKKLVNLNSVNDVRNGFFLFLALVWTRVVMVEKVRSQILDIF